jgi:tetratricopeptide (TPR) repeat protein
MNRITVWLLAAACGIAITTAGATARAQKDADPAKAAFAGGSRLFDKGDFPAAAEAFREANRLNPSWKLYYNIGRAEAAAERYGLALEAFEQYLAEGGDVGGMALSLDKQLKKDCANNQCLPAQHDDIAKRDKLGVASTVLIVAGAALSGRF